MSNCDFGWELALQGGGDFFQVGLEKTLCIKNSEYESKKMIPNAVSTISHFQSPTLTNLW